MPRSMWTKDLRFVLRGLRRGTAAIAAGAALLSVGIAAVLLTAGLVDTLLLRQVSATYGSHLRRIVAIERQGSSVTRFSFPELQLIRERVGDSGQLTAVSLQPVIVRVNDADVQTMAEVVEGPYFPLTGTQTLLGRPLVSTDAAPASPPVAILAEPFWRRYFNASSNVLGNTIRLNGASFAVVGVADTLASPAFMGASVDVWVSIAHADPLLDAGWRGNVQARWFTAFVLPNASNARLETRLDGAEEELRRRYADTWRDRGLQTSEAVVVGGSLRSAATAASVVLAGLAVLIVLSAASNVSGVLIARAACNRRAVAIHMSIGAGRGVVMRRQLMEGALVGALAGGLAVVLYLWMRNELAEVAVLPTLAFRLDLPFSAGIVALALGSGVIAGTLLALGPAIWTRRIDITAALGDGDGRAGAGPRTSRLRQTLVAAQIALSLVLVVGASFLFRSLDGLLNIDLGFPRSRLVAMDFDVEPVVNTPGDLRALARDALDRVNALPSVFAAAMSNRAPVDQSTPTLELRNAADNSQVVGDVTVYLATERYFETVGVPMTRGRPFTQAEVAAAADVVVVNESLAERFWPGGDALERSVYIGDEMKPLRVIGVARDAKYRTITERARPHIYRPSPPALGLTLIARTRDEPRAALRVIQRELDEVGPGIAGFFPRTLDDHLAVQLLPTRAAANAAGVLGALALALSAAALYAFVSWFVVLRRREIGVRMALGASAADVRRMVVGQALSAALPGVVCGAVVAVALASLAGAVLVGVSPLDPVALGGGIVTSLAVILVAGYIPSRVAAAVDPGQALRQ